MKDFFQKTVSFIKDNPSIIYALFLIVLVPAAFFLNTYLINSRYEEAIDTITLNKVNLIEYVISDALKNDAGDNQRIQDFIDRIMNEKGSIISLSVIKPNDNDELEIVAASDPSLIGQKQDNSLLVATTWTRPEEFAFQGGNEKGRYWQVARQLTDDSGKKIGIITLGYSIADSDAYISRIINNSYWLLLITVLIVILFTSNQARVFGYALSLTKIKEIDKMKDMFISMAGHELRSPLTAIKGYLEFLQEKKSVMEDKENGHYIENISLSVDRLQNLVNDVLEVSRIEGNRLPVEIIEFDPNPVIAESIEEIKSQAMQKGLELGYEPMENGAVIKADPARFKQVLINLIGNSIKYTEKGSVQVSAALKDNEFALTIADTGIGISSDDQKKLFQKFSRIQNDKTKNIIGTGLGLWITAEIIRRMKGRITVESIEGVGSHFSVYLPLAKK